MYYRQPSLGNFYVKSYIFQLVSFDNFWFYFFHCLLFLTDDEHHHSLSCFYFCEQKIFKEEKSITFLLFFKVEIIRGTDFVSATIFSVNVIFVRNGFKILLCIEWFLAPKKILNQGGLFKVRLKSIDYLKPSDLGVNLLSFLEKI